MTTTPIFHSQETFQILRKTLSGSPIQAGREGIKNTMCVCPCLGHKDYNASLSIGISPDNKILYHCFAGCRKEDVREELEKILSIYSLSGEITPINIKSTKVKPQGSNMYGLTKICTYIYRDACGVEKFYVHRYLDADGKKTFRQALPTGEHKGPIAADRVLYNLHEVATKLTEPVFFVEGEKDVDTLGRLGILATCIAGGASAKILDIHIKALEGRDVVVIADNDVPGELFARNIVDRLIGVATSVSFVSFKSVGKDSWRCRNTKGYDVSDLIFDFVAQKGEDVELAKAFVLNVVAKAKQNISLGEPYTTNLGVEEEPKEEPAPSTERKELEDTLTSSVAEIYGFDYTDTAWAQMLSVNFEHRLKYLQEKNSWAFFNKHTGEWQENDEKYGFDAVRWMYRKQKELLETVTFEHIEKEAEREKVRHLVRKQVCATGNTAKINSILSSASTMCGLRSTMHEFDTDQDIINCQNGIVNLKTGELLPHSYDHKCLLKAPVRYETSYSCNSWMDFLYSTFDTGDYLETETIIRYMQKICGYVLTGKTTEQCVFFLYGSGANGKTIFIETLKNMVGSVGESGYAGGLNIDGLLDNKFSKSDTMLTEIASLVNKRVVSTSEVKRNSSFNDANFKNLAGGDSLQARFLYGKHFTVEPTWKLLIRGNHKPKVDASDNGMWRRLRYIGFYNTFSGDSADMFLQEKLNNELSAIFSWAVAGAIMWYREGLGAPPARFEEDKEKYKEANQDSFIMFLKDRCVCGEGSSIAEKELYQMYKTYCIDAKEVIPSLKEFYSKLDETKFKRDRGFVVGVAAKPEDYSEMFS